MSDTVTLTLKDAIDGRVVADAILPDRFATLSTTEIAHLPIWLTRHTSPPALADATGCDTDRGTRGPDQHSVELGDLFSVRGERSAVVRVQGNLTNVDGIGAAMAGGTISIDGNAGRELGRAMTGGTIAVHGNVGDDAGVAMAGGAVLIWGSAADRVGGALPGASRGMTGGEIFVRRNVGRDAGTGVRRGLIVVGGDAGDGTARAMIAGTVLVMGTAAGTVGLWNKRGTVVALGGATVPATYRYACTYRPPYLRLIFAYLRRAHGVPVDDRYINGQYARYCGDLSEIGKGELLLWTDS
jgi:formylmethanofuran dehydrogenase subunit C